MDVIAWITVTLMVNILAFTFQLAAYISPLWLWLQNGSTYSGMGLWYSVGCTESTCFTTAISILKEVQSTGFPFTVVRIMQSMGMVGILIVTILLLVLRLGYSHKSNTMRSINTAAFVVCIITLLVLLASIILFVAYFSSLFVLMQMYDSISLPWSPIMSALATIILCVICAFIRVHCRPKAYNGQEFPMSDDPKLELQPQMQNGNVSRYFNPTPYMDSRDRFTDDYRPVRGEIMSDYRSGGHYNNRGYQHEREPNVIYYGKATPSQSFRDNGDRDLGHTIYTDRGFSKLDTSSRSGRQVALPDYSREGHYDPYSRDQMVAYGGRRMLPDIPPSNVYRPQYY